MREWTGKEIMAARESLESGAAKLLGRMLFEFSRLDVSLGLCLVWVENGKNLEKLTKKVEAEGFAARLARLEKQVNKATASESEARAAYLQWISSARHIRLTRNDLVHGRWGVEPIKGQIVNVVGLPTSLNQRSIEYSLAELEQVLTEIVQVQKTLSTLRSRWPL